MRIWDITRKISPGMLIWPGDPPPSIHKQFDIAAGDTVSTSLLEIGTHTGTHADAPAHLLASGKTVEQLDLGVLVGPVDVVDVNTLNAIPSSILDARVPPGCRRILFKVTAPAQRMNEFSLTVPLTLEAAQWLINHQVQLVGTSGMTVDAVDSERLEIHRQLLAANIVIVENLALEDVPEGHYQLACLPLAICGADGAPARAILWEE